MFPMRIIMHILGLPASDDHLILKLARGLTGAEDPDRVLRRHDKAKLVTVALASFGERLTVGAIAARIVKLAGSPLARDAIALHVSQMRPRRACIPALMRTIRVLMATRR